MQAEKHDLHFAWVVNLQINKFTRKLQSLIKNTDDNLKPLLWLSVRNTWKEKIKKSKVFKN